VGGIQLSGRAWFRRSWIKFPAQHKHRRNLIEVQQNVNMLILDYGYIHRLIFVGLNLKKKKGTVYKTN
jgi:hypothetical protein